MSHVWRVLADNLGWKLLSVLLAVLLWVAVEGEPELVTVETVPVYYRNVDPGLALVATPPQTVRVELRGPSDVMGRENLSNVAVVVDLHGMRQPGETMFPITDENVTQPASVTFVRSDPPELRLHLERAPDPKGNSTTKQ